MAFIEREILKPVKEQVFTCDFVWRPAAKLEELPGIHTCKNESVARDNPPPTWAVVTINHSFSENEGTTKGYKGNFKLLHFCPEHASKVESRLARILEP